jgi:Ca2+-dependent lipid-binding protein
MKAYNLLYDHLACCINNETKPCCPLKVNIVEGRQIKNEDPFGESDPFIEIYLRKSHQLQRTQVVQDKNNPVWNERFIFEVQLGDDIIHFTVYDEDVKNNDVIGSGEVELKDVFDDGKFDKWVQVRATSGSSVSGEIHIIMSFEVSCFDYKSSQQKPIIQYIF